MGWEKEPKLSQEEKLLQTIEDSSVGQSTALVAALALRTAFEHKGEIERHVMLDVIKSALMMVKYAGECENLEFMSKTLPDKERQGITLKQVLSVLPLLRLAAGKKAADWGDNLQKLMQLIEGK